MTQMVTIGLEQIKNISMILQLQVKKMQLISMEKKPNTYLQRGTLFAKSGAYSYDLEVGGHVKDSYTGEYIAGQFTTPAGSTVINNNQYLSSRELSFLGENVSI